MKGRGPSVAPRKAGSRASELARIGETMEKRETLSCSFCGKSQKEVKKLIA